MKRVDKADALEAARRWDRHHPDLDAEVQPLADELEAEAAVLADEGQWSAAYLTYARVMRLDPSRSWTRRAAEQARDESLGIAVSAEERYRRGWRLSLPAATQFSALRALKAR